jgi:hypothetical protein
MIVASFDHIAIMIVYITIEILKKYFKIFYESTNFERWKTSKTRERIDEYKII